MTARDVQDLQHRLDSIVRQAQLLRSQIPDLHSMAYEAPVGDDPKVTESKRFGYYLDDVGDAFARKVLTRLSEIVRQADDVLTGFSATVGNMMSVGQTPEHTRGSLVSSADLAKQIQRQRQREACGEYTPRRMIPQPRYPGK